MSKKRKMKGRLPEKRKKVQKDNSNVTSQENQNSSLTLQATDQPWDETRKKMLFVSFGQKDRVLPNNFKRNEWNITFVDANRLTELSQIESDSYDFIWSVNHLSCLNAHEIPVVVKEIYRILTPNGLATLSVPNLNSVSEVIAGGKLEGELYKVGDNSVAPIDLVYGNRKFIATGHPYLASKTGFSPTTLGNKFFNIGFGRITIDALAMPHVIWLTAFKVPLPANGKPIINIKDVDINDMMQKRDALEKEPVIWNDQLTFG